MPKKINDPDPGFSRTLSEYLLQPGLVNADVGVDTIDLSTSLVVPKKRKIELEIPVITAAMQSVTGSRMAIAIAKLGGAGVIYCSQPIEDEAKMVKEVKKFKAGFVIPEVLSPEHTVQYAMERMRETGYSKFPVTEKGEVNGKLLGLLTDNDFDPELHKGLRVKERMRTEGLHVAYDDEVKDDIRAANVRLREGHHSVLPIVYRDGRLKSLVFRKDMLEHERNPFELLDDEKRFIVGAAINTHDFEERTPALVDAGVDFLVIDTSQGYSEFVKRTMEYTNKQFPQIPVIGGNVITSDGFEFMAEQSVDAVKVGMGSGSICITQEQIRVGRGQATAVREVSEARDRYHTKYGRYIPICSDGGVLTSGDILVALGMGADYVMVGSYVAGSDESPTEVDIMRREVDGRMMEMKVKPYWGEGSNRARELSKLKELSGVRYGHTRFEEGYETVVPYVGPLRDHLLPTLAKIRDGIRKSGSRSIAELHDNAVLEVLSPVSISISRGKPVIGK